VTWPEQLAKALGWAAVALFALLRAGAIPVMCLTGHRAAELGHFAAVSQAKALLIPDTAAGFDYRPMAQELVQANPGCVTSSSTVIPDRS
jgi:non-ribosomal peptide synthetase component E (peptide arylation enzyme)